MNETNVPAVARFQRTQAKSFEETTSFEGADCIPLAGCERSPSRTGKDDRSVSMCAGCRSGLVVDQKRRERRAAVAAGPGGAARAVGRRRRGRQRFLQRLQELLQDVVGRARARGAVCAVGRGRTISGWRTAMMAVMSAAGAAGATSTVGAVGEFGLEDALPFRGLIAGQFAAGSLA